MMIHTGLNQQDKRKSWCEVISTATKLDNIMVRTNRTKPPYTLCKIRETLEIIWRNGSG